MEFVGEMGNAAVITGLYQMGDGGMDLTVGIGSMTADVAGGDCGSG